MADYTLPNGPQAETPNDSRASPGYMTPDETKEFKTETPLESHTNELFAYQNSDLEKQACEKPVINSSNSAQLENEPAEASDPNLVTWDGPDDPKMPMNWSGVIKGGNITVLSIMTFITQDPPSSSAFSTDH